MMMTRALFAHIGGGPDELGLDGAASATGVVLAAYRKWGTDCLNHFRGMFGFALWDEGAQTLFCARDRFGIVPLYYSVVGEVFFFASEAKALFVEKIETDLDGFKDYLGFQFCLAGKTLFKGIRELLPGHRLRVVNGQVEISRYWQVYYNLDFDHTLQYFEAQVRDLLIDSVRLHLRSDVPVAELVFSTVHDGKAIVDTVRMHTSVAHLKRVADVICRTLDHQPPKMKPKKR